MKVLFVCSGNSYRSPLAEALLKKFNPLLTVDSAGTEPTTSISEEAGRYLAREEAKNLLKKTPHPLEDKNLQEYDLIIAMKPRHREAVINACPKCKEKTIVWNIDDPIHHPLGYAEEVFHKIKQKVLELSNSLPR